MAVGDGDDFSQPETNAYSVPPSAPTPGSGPAAPLGRPRQQSEPRPPRPLAAEPARAGSRPVPYRHRGRESLPPPGAGDPRRRTRLISRPGNRGARPVRVYGLGFRI